ncbi:hypothetical protein ACFW9D_06030 [Streptomyces sp. NPDC059524]|uniref:hypothetical protein n=1 Tax=Streptomyces sp. NPDC059524 TaxID=3346856 RepID=UPI00367A5C48
MRDAVIVDAVHTPVGKGKPGGALAGILAAGRRVPHRRRQARPPPPPVAVQQAAAERAFTLRPDPARDVEGYPDLVVHGPLLALSLLELPRRHAPGRPGTAPGVTGTATLAP